MLVQEKQDGATIPVFGSSDVVPHITEIPGGLAIRPPKVVAVIPARSGSVGVPNKNIRLLGGKPLLAWAIEAAKGSELVSRVVVDTDSEEYAEIARRYGAETPYLRPPELAEDVPTEDVLIHALKQLGDMDVLVCLQCTTPFISAGDIDACVYAVLKGEAESAITVVEASGVPWTFELDPTGYLHLNQDHFHHPFFNNADELRGEWGVRQHFPRFYMPNGGVYAMRPETFLAKRQIIVDRCKPVVMPKIRSLDVDSEEDFLILEALVKAGYP